MVHCQIQGKQSISWEEIFMTCAEVFDRGKDDNHLYCSYISIAAKWLKHTVKVAFRHARP